MPSNYSVYLNATVYYATIDVDHPLNTTVFRVRAIINSITDFVQMYLSIEQVDQLFEIEGNNYGIILLKDDLEEDGDVHVFDASVNLTVEPDSQFQDSIYPVSLDININLVATYHPANPIKKISKGLGCIQNSSGE